MRRARYRAEADDGAVSTARRHFRSKYRKALMFDWPELIVRALLGGAIVSAFALVGDLLKPKSFAGLFGAAPSVALASIALTFRAHDASYVATEARSMIAGAAAFAAYAYGVCLLLRHGTRPVGTVSTLALVVWFAASFALWKGVLAHLH